MRMRRVAVGIAVALVLAGCAGGREDDPVIEGLPAPPSTSTSTSTTLAPPTSTTSTTAPPISLQDPRVLAVVSPAGVVLPVVGRDGGGPIVNTPCGRQTLVTAGTPVTQATVVLDPGHGGSEFGAVDPRGQGFTEKVPNLAVAKAAEEALRAAGVTVVLTRTGDYRMTLGARAKVATTLQPQAFVSIHHNGESDEPSPRPGTETYYQVGSPSTAAQSKRLAGLIYEEVLRTLSQYPGIPWQSDRDAGAKYRRNDRGGDYYGILRLSAGVTAVLAELAFLSNPAERDLLTRPDVQQAEGQALARGILRFLTTQDPGSGFVEPYPRDSPAGGGGGAAGCEDPPLG